MNISKEIEAICDAIGMPRVLLSFPTRKPEIVHPRQVAMHCLDKAGYRKEDIGIEMDKDRVTVWHSCKKVEAAIDGFDPDLKRYYDRVKDRPVALLK